MSLEDLEKLLEERLRNPAIATVVVKKAIAAAGDYAAEDVISGSASVSEAWKFPGLARKKGGSGYIIKAIVAWETTALTPLLTLYLFKKAPTSELRDNVANTAILFADIDNYVGKIDWAALEDLGGVSDALVTSSDDRGLPLAFNCAEDEDGLYGVLVTRDAITGEAAGENLTIILEADQN